MPFACIFVPDFPVQAMVRAEPELHNFAVAVLEGAPPLESLAAMNEFARASGVQMGMPRALLEQCSSLVLRLRSPEREAETHAALLRVAHSFSPRVEETAADTLLLDLQGMEALLGAPEQIAAAMAQRVTQLGVQASIAIAANADAARAAARGFRGVTVIAPGCETTALGPLPLAVLDAPPEILETLARWGIRDFRALAALPTAQLSERLGQAGVHLQALARGTFARALRSEETAVEFTESLEMESTVEDLEALAFLLNRMLQDVCGRLTAHALATNEVRVCFALDIAAGASRQRAEDAVVQARHTVEPAASSLFEKTLRLPVPSSDPALLLNLLRLALAAHPPQAPIEKITLTAHPARVRTAQGGLFVPLGPDPQKLEVTLARIAGIVGAGNVGSPELLDSHRPGAFQMQRFVAAAPVRATLQTQVTRAQIAEVPPESGAASPITLRVFRPPVAAAVHLQSDVPARVSFGGVRGTVRKASGPWRTSGDWWRPDGWQHDMWDIEIAVGGSDALGFYQIYFDRRAGMWFVRGEYD